MADAMKIYDYINDQGGQRELRSFHRPCSHIGTKSTIGRIELEYEVFIEVIKKIDRDLPGMGLVQVGLLQELCDIFGTC
jgi:ferritin